MTYTSKYIIKKLIEGNGIYEDDPQMTSVWKYSPNFDSSHKELYAVFSNEKWNDIHKSPFVKNPILLWDQANGITQEGKEFLKKN